MIRLENYQATYKGVEYELYSYGLDFCELKTDSYHILRVRRQDCLIQPKTGPENHTLKELVSKIDKSLDYNHRNNKIRISKEFTLEEMSDLLGALRSY